MQSSNKNKPSTKKNQSSSILRLTYMGLAIALALIFSYIETLITILPTIPGIKLGLSNGVVLIMFFLEGPKEAGIIAIMKTILSAFLFSGFATLLYGLSGVLCAFAAMWITWHFHWSIIGISITGALAHNTGQILIAVLVLQNAHVFVYYPILIIAGLIVGTITGFIAKMLLKYLKAIPQKTKKESD